MLYIQIFLISVVGWFTGKFLAQVVHMLPKILLGDHCVEDGQEVFKLIFNSKNHSKFLRFNKLIFAFSLALFFGAMVLIFSLSVSLLIILLMICLLVCCFITDYEHGILPDQFTLSLLWLGLIGSLFPVFISPQEAILGAVIGYGFFWIINVLYRLFRGFDGMYSGDFKLNAAIGACVGVKLLIPTLLLSLILLIFVTLIQMLFSKKSFNRDVLHKEIPYGCFASVVTVSMMLYLFSMRGH